MFDAFQRIRIINLPERQDRRREMLHELARIGLAGDPRIAFVAAEKPYSAAPFRSNGEHGCFLSHLKLIRDAAEAGESLLILEDECDFTREVRKPLPESDLLWGGYAIFRTYIVGGHCIGLSATTAKKMHGYLEPLLEHPSPPPIDGAYDWFCRDHPEVTVNACASPIAVQRPSYSNIAGRHGLDRLRLLQPLIDLMRRVKRIFYRRRKDALSFDEFIKLLRSGSV